MEGIYVDLMFLAFEFPALLTSVAHVIGDELLIYLPTLWAMCRLQ